MWAQTDTAEMGGGGGVLKDRGTNMDLTERFEEGRGYT